MIILPNTTVGIIQCLQEGGLQLGQEGLEHSLCLLQEDGEGVQHSSLNTVHKSVSKDSDERTSDVYHRWFQSFSRGYLDDFT